MDLTTRAFLLLGMIVVIIAIAGVVLYVGRGIMSDSNGQAFEVGKGRARSRKKVSKKQKQQILAARAAAAQQAQAQYPGMPPGYIPQGMPGVAAAPPTQGFPAGYVPQGMAGGVPQGGSAPFGGVTQSDEEW